MQNPSDRELLKTIASQRRELTPDVSAAFQAFQSKVFAEGALSAKSKQIIAVAVAHVTQCQQCIQSHTKAALRAGATPPELMEAVWVAAEMRAGGAYAHSTVMLAAINEEQSAQGAQECRS
ncbi:MAG: carboxymuconolactone decarboxylase family protein [Phycisphaerae bacterium]|nr:carboxymuconolactone decarboxylase family protein [Phycisphaerae bacterium]